MTPGQAEPEDRLVLLDVYERLVAATPEEKVRIVVQLLGAHPEARLELPARDGRKAMLDEVVFAGLPVPISLRQADLSGASLRKARLGGVDLCGAVLRAAALGEADLRGALLEEADLGGADLAGADLREAALGNADLQGALLEEANLRGAALRFADFRGAALENADLRGADLWGANLEGAVLTGVDLRGAVIKETNLRKADLTGANLEGLTVGKADLQDAILKDAMLSRAVLSTCTLTHIHLGGAWMEKTRLRRDQLGEAIGEERVGEFAEAAQGYLALERNFIGLGDPDTASWAYRRRRRMQKRESMRRMRAALAENRWRDALAALARFASDQLVEWICDYGESIPRVLASLILLNLAFSVLYGLTGSVVRVRATPAGAVRVPTHNPMDLATFSLLAMSTSGSPAVGLLPRDESVHFLMAAEAFSGIALTGLLGFVLGNRIRR